MQEPAEIQHVPLGLVRPHPKNNFYFHDLGDDELQDLADSIKETGMLQLPEVCRDGSGGYITLFGHQRIRAARLLGWTSCEVKIRDNIDPESEEAELILLTENFHRRQLTRLEISRATKRLAEMGMSGRQISEKTGLSERTVDRIKTEDTLLRELAGLLDEEGRRLAAKLPEEAQRHMLSCILREKNEAGRLKLRLTEAENSDKDHMRRMMDAELQLRTIADSKRRQDLEMQKRTAELIDLKQQLNEATRAAENEPTVEPDPEAETLRSRIDEMEEELESARRDGEQLQEALDQHREEIEKAKADRKAAIEEAVAAAKAEYEESLREQQDAQKAVQAQLEALQAKIEKHTNKPMPLRISQYVGSCLIQDRLVELLIAQIEEVIGTMEGKAKADLKSFHMVPPDLVDGWVRRMDILQPRMAEVSRLLKIYHKE